MEPYQHPHRSKERGDVWNQITVNLSDLDHPKFKVNQRSMRVRLTLLITKHTAKIRQEENATGITCKDTELDLALEEIIDRRSWSTKNLRGKKKKVKAHSSQRPKRPERLSRFLLHESCLEVLPLPPGWDANPSQGYSPSVC